MAQVVIIDMGLFIRLLMLYSLITCLQNEPQVTTKFIFARLCQW